MKLSTKREIARYPRGPRSYRPMLFGVIVFWMCVIAFMVISTTDAKAETIDLRLPDGSVVKAEVVKPEPDKYDKTFQMMNDFATPVGVPTTNGGTIYLTPTYGEALYPVYGR